MTKTLIYKTDDGPLSFIEDIHEGDVQEYRDNDTLVYLVDHEKEVILDVSKLNDNDSYIVCHYSGKQGEYHHAAIRNRKETIMSRMESGRYKEGVFFYKFDKDRYKSVAN